MYFIVEFHLYKDCINEMGDIENNGYTVFQTPRQGRKGGRIPYLFKEEPNVKRFHPPFH